MLFRQLEYFVAVARERHFARAAEACFVSQPALSVSIAKLERELNVTLINRGHNYQGLTPEGERLVVWAKRILAEQEAFKAEVAAVQSGITGTLRLGAEPTASTTLALPVMAFCTAHPLAKVQVRSRLSTTELIRQLRAFELDAAIAHFGPEDRDGLQVTPLYRGAVHAARRGRSAAAPVRHPHLGRGVPAAARAAHPRHADPSGHRRSVHPQRSHRHPAGGDRLRGDPYANVGAGACTSIVPHTWLRALPVTGRMRVLRRVEPDARALISVAIHDATPGSLAARAFMTAAASLRLDEFFDQPLPVPEPLVR